MTFTTNTSVHVKESPKRICEVLDLEAETNDHMNRLDFEQQLKIVVRPEQGGSDRHLFAPANIAKARSAWIRRRWDQGSTTMCITGDGTLVSAYSRLICTDQVVLASDEGIMRIWDKYKATIKLYLLAQTLEDAVSTNLIIDHLARLLDSTTFHVRLVSLTVPLTESGSPLRRFLWTT